MSEVFKSVWQSVFKAVAASEGITVTDIDGSPVVVPLTGLDIDGNPVTISKTGLDIDGNPVTVD